MTDRADRQPEQGPVGEGRLHPRRGEHARQRRGAGRRAGDRARPAGARPRLRRRHHGAARRRGSGQVAGVDIAANLVAAGNARAAAEGLANLTFREGDATDLTRPRRRLLRPRRLDLRRDVRPAPFDVAKEMVR